MNRRRVLIGGGKGLLGLLAGGAIAARPSMAERLSAPGTSPRKSSGLSRDAVRLFLCGDVMTGRGIDQILPHAGNRRIYEPYLQDALAYVMLAERNSGPIPRPVSFDYIWGDALEELQRFAPDARIINLETAITEHDDFWDPKGIQYRMHPANVPVLTIAGVDCCVLANNHVMDWETAGLLETLQTLHRVGIRTAGAGRNHGEAQAPSVIDLPSRGRLLIFAYGSPSSGIPRAWGAHTGRPGVNLLGDLSAQTLARIARTVASWKRAGDLVVISIHWGSNWGYGIPPAQQFFAHRLIDEAGVDVIHGHSSHHPRGIEVYREKLILYGCGDFINDYEGIGGRQSYRADLRLMYFLEVDTVSGRLLRLEMTPLQVRQLRLQRAIAEDTHWLQTILEQEGERFGTGVEATEAQRLALRW